MEKDFWLEAWREGRTRFHRDKPNDDLVQYLPLFEGSRQVFVPLCGKSLDLLYLKEQGLSVLGVELSPLPLEQFKIEHQLEVTTQKLALHTLWQFDQNLQIYQGDLFELTPDQLKGTDVLYDRASLVALPQELRKRYYGLLKGLPSPLSILLISFEYDQMKASGPPFSVPEDEMRNELASAFEIELLDRRQVEDLNPKFVEAGLEEFFRVVYRLKKRAQS